MAEYLEAINNQYVFIFVQIIIGVLSIFIARMIYGKAPRMFTTAKSVVYGNRHRIKEGNYIDPTEIVLKTNRDLSEMSGQLVSMRSQQHDFVNQINEDLEFFKNDLMANVRTLIEEDDENRRRLAQVLAEFQKDLEEMRENRSSGRMDDWTQTTNKVMRSDQDGTKREEASKEATRNFVAVIKRALTEFLSEARRHMAAERHEMTREIQRMTTLMCRQEAASKSFVPAVVQPNAEQLATVGWDAAKCFESIAGLYESAMADRYKESADKMTEILEFLQNTTSDMAGLKETLERIDGQFGDICQRLDLSNQRTSENCAEAVRFLRTTARDCEQRTHGLQETGLELGTAANKLKDLVASLNLLLGGRDGEGDGCSGDISTSGGCQILPSAFQLCTRKLSNLGSTVEEGTAHINKSIHILTSDLKILSKSVEEGVRRLNGSGGNAESHDAALIDHIMAIKEGVEVPSEADTESSCQWPDDSDYPQVISVIESNLKSALKTKKLDELRTDPARAANQAAAHH